MRWIVLSCLFLVLASCKKDPIQYTFEGTISRNIGLTALEGVDVEISYKPFNGAVTSNNFVVGGTAVTDANGYYQIIFEREKSTEFVVELRKDGYFPVDVELLSSAISSENPNEVNATMDAQAFVQFNIQNTAPSNASDNLQLIFYTYRTGCDGCITTDYNYFDGIVDTVVTYQNTAGQYLKFTYVDVNAGQSTTDSLYMTPFDTTYYSILY